MSTVILLALVAITCAVWSFVDVTRRRHRRLVLDARIGRVVTTR